MAWSMRSSLVLKEGVGMFSGSGRNQGMGLSSVESG